MLKNFIVLLCLLGSIVSYSQTLEGDYLLLENNNEDIWSIRNDDDWALRMWPGGSATVNTFTQDGKVGINKKYPQSTLHVNGRAYFGNAWGYSPFSTTNGSYVVIDWVHENNWNTETNKWAGFIGFNAERYNGSNKDWYKGLNQYTAMGAMEVSNDGFKFLYHKNAQDSHLSHKLDQYMKIDNDGNVIIGPGNEKPGYKLSVRGKAVFEEVLVQLSQNWGDFVFDENYDLNSLEETESYIKKNKHLPGIPSADSLDNQGGIELGEMQRLQMIKIEELTLHMIEINKEKKALLETNNQLKEEQSVLKEENQEIKAELNRIETLLEEILEAKK